MLRGLALFVLLSSCAGHIKIISDGCEAHLKEALAEDTFDIHEHVWSSSETTISLREILQKHNYDCKKTKKLSVKVGQSSTDILASVIPFTNRMSIWLKTYE